MPSSVIMGFFLWSMLNNLYYYKIIVSVPLCFYNTERISIVDAPQTITVAFKGRRTDLIAYDVQHYVVRYNAQKLHQGENEVCFTPQDFFLPPTISMISCKPMCYKIIVQTLMPA
ncbi:MAG: hypothetical protein WC707_00240 [Candidatus Babeliaceae bacterium]